MLTDKQRFYYRNADRRWNIKVGAVRSGKTYCDFFTIPKRIRACTGDGLIVLLGTTVGTLCRNLLDPMRELWGEYLVGRPSSKDTVSLFGRTCWLIGASRADQAAKLQGSGVEYAYGDEITTWHPQVFEMLKSRLDKPNSRFDGTCNPASPDHWFKAFLDSDADIFLQTYTIDDNPHLSPTFVHELKKEYLGTVSYDRYILGKWCAAEGAVYRRFADNPSSFLIDSDSVSPGDISRISVGVDFGGSRSATAFVACAILGNYDSVVVLASERHLAAVDSDRLGELFCQFLLSVEASFSPVSVAYCDSAEPVLIRSLKKAARLCGLSVSVRPALKLPVNDRIRLLNRLLAQRRFRLTEACDSLSLALRSAVWLPDTYPDARRDDGSSDIDSLDALEYALERDLRRFE